MVTPYAWNWIIGHYKHLLRGYVQHGNYTIIYNCNKIYFSGLFIPISSPVATFEQSKNVAIAHIVGASCCFEGCGLCNRFHLRMRMVLMGNLAQAGYCLCMNYVCLCFLSMYC